MDIVQEVLTTFNDYADLLKKVITGDESGLVEKKKREMADPIVTK